MNARRIVLIGLVSTICLTTQLAFGAKDRYPSTFAITNNPLSASYCQNGTATAITATSANQVCGPNGGTSNVNVTVVWYQSATNAYSGSPVLTTGPVATTTTSFNYTPPTTSAGTLYYYATISWAAGGTCAPAGSINTSIYSVTVSNTFPSITSQPSTAGETLCKNATPTALSVSASAGGGTISNYKWYKNAANSNSGGTLVATNTSSATTDTYSPVTSTAGTLYYYCIVSNTSGCTVTSNVSGAIVVSNSGGPNITTQPSTATQTFCLNGTATALTVAAGGGPTYQWYSSPNSDGSGSTLIAGAIAASYVPLTTSTGTLYYYCLVSNGSCSLKSNVSGAIVINPLPTTAAAGVDQIGAATCGLTQVTLAGNTPTTGTGSWSVVSGTGGSFGNSASPTSTFNGTAGSTYTLRWSISNSPCTVSTDDVIITFNQNATTANAGGDQTGATTCGLTQVTLGGNTPTTGSGTWSITSGTGGSFGNASLATSTFNGVAGNSYTLQWTISNVCSSSSDDVNITFNPNPTTANAGPDQTNAATCGQTQVTLAANSPTTGTGSWSIIGGSGGLLGDTSSPTSTFDGVAGNTYTLRWTITNSPCTNSTDDVVITFNQNPTVANAGPDEPNGSACGVTLAANTPTIGTGSWSVVSGTGGTFGDALSPSSTFSGSVGSYTLRWTINNAPCTASTDDVVITFILASAISNAGPDQTGAATCGLTQVTLAANSPAVGTGSWSIQSGAGGSFVDTADPASVFNGVNGNSYTLRWTVVNPPCADATDDVVITFNQSPTAADAGVDQTDIATCGLTQVTLAGNTPSVGTGGWSVISGTGGSFGDSTSPTSTFNGTAGNTYTLRWTITNAPCVSTDDVDISFNQNPTAANAGADQTGAATCGMTQVTLAGNSPTIGTGAWSIISGTGGSFGDSASPTSTFDGTAGNTYTLRWTISYSPCTASSDDVDVTFNQTPTTSSITGSVSVCPASVEGYSVTNTAGSSYDWVIIGGTQTAGNNTNSISVTWGGTGSGNVAVTETNAGGCVGTTVNLPVNVQSTAWSGSAGTDWSNAANWVCGAPSSLTDATIPAGASNYPVVTSNSAVRNISIANNASLSLSSGITLDVYGDWTNDGAFTHGNGKVSFSGSSQKIQGAATATFYNIDVNASASVSIESNQNLAGTLTLGSGSSLDADGPSGTAVFTLLSSNDSPTQDGSIAAIPTGASVSGNIKVQRYMGPEGRYNRYISSPVTGATVSDVINNPPSNSFTIVNNLAQTYTESVAGSSNKGYSSVALSAVMNPAKGYLIMPNTAYAAIPLVWDVTGTVANGNVNLNPTFNSTLDVNNDGWNLVGNPYPSGVLWSWGPGNTTLWSDGTTTAIPANIDAVAQVPDIAHNVFHTWDATSGTGDLPGGIIATGQAFWIHANAGGPLLTIHQAAKTSTSGEFFRQNTDRLPKGLKVSLISELATDNSFILLRNGSTFGYDKGMDAAKRYGEAPGVAVLNNQHTELVHAAIPSFEEDIALAINANQEGDYSFSFESIRGLSEFDELYLADLYKNEVVQLTQGSYTFHVSSNLATRDGRFFITRQPEKYTSEKALQLSVYPNPVRDRFKVETNSDGFIELLNSFGQILLQHSMTSADGRTIAEIDMTGLPTGVYVIRATSMGKSTTKRIIKE